MHRAGAAPRAGQAGWLGAWSSSRWAALPFLMTGTFVIVMDFFIVNVAFPSMQRSLHAGPSAVEWVVAGYGLTFASLLIASGRLGDRFGRRRLFAMGLGLFVVASTACAFAPDATVLVVARLVQGSGAAMISSNVLSIIGVIYTGFDRVRAISIYGITLGIAAASGQFIGGLLIAANPFGLGWRAIFLINVPVGLVALILSPRFIPESHASRPRPLDLVGMALVTIGLTAVVLPLIEGPQLSWPRWTWLCLSLAVPVLAAFVAYEMRVARHGRAPLVEPSVFRKRSLSAGLVTQLALWCSMASFFLVLALYLQHGRGMNPLQAGSVFTFLAGAYLIASLRAPALTRRFGRSLITIGGLCGAAGFGALLAAVDAAGTGGSVWALVPGLVTVGAGQGLTITPLITIVLSHAEPERAGQVSGILSTTQQIGNALGVAVTGAIFFSAVHDGYAKAFTSSLIELLGVTVAMIVISRFLPNSPTIAPKALRPAPGGVPTPERDPDARTCTALRGGDRAVLAAAHPCDHHRRGRCRCALRASRKALLAVDPNNFSDHST
jgi:EmrB/QacA subfamily drug resistance transporter